MENRPSKTMNTRGLSIVLIMCIFGFGVALYGLFRAQVIDGEKFRAKAQSQQFSDVKIAATRGTIYDCNMNIIARSADVSKVFIDPSKIADDEMRIRVAKTLSDSLAIDYNDIYDKAGQKDKKYIVVKTQVENDVRNKLKKIIISTKGFNQIIGFDADVKRYYPLSNFASTVIGFTGENDVGLSGLEYYYNDALTGIPGRSISAKDALQYQMDSNYAETYKPTEGKGLVLTINQVIQHYLDAGLSQAVSDWDANYGYGIVMDVETGAILAMSTQPDYNLNNPNEIENKRTLIDLKTIKDTSELQKAISVGRYSQWRNRTISDSYEPGSVFKCFTASAAIEENVVNDSTTFYCSGSIKIADRTYKCHETKGHGRENVTDALVTSCNPAFIEMGQKLGSEKFFKYFEAFGFTEKTGIDLPAESAPNPNITYHDKAHLGPVQLASSSFGQSFQVTPVQIIDAISAIANGGKLMQPYVVNYVLDQNGNRIKTTSPKVKRQVVSESTAQKVIAMMEQGVIRGTAKNAYISGYRVAGKTGTSQKLLSSGVYISSFVGFAPANNPKIAILIVVDEPRAGSIYGGTVAAPVAAEILKNTLIYFNVEPEYTDEELSNMDVKVISYVNQNVNSAKSDLIKRGFAVKVVGEGDKVLSQFPEPNAVIPKNGIITFITGENLKPSPTKMPDFNNKNVLEVSKLAKNSGVNFKMSGYVKGKSVVAYKQSIAPATEVSTGTIVTVYFKSNENVADN